jgi:hypothetical protein
LLVPVIISGWLCIAESELWGSVGFPLETMSSNKLGNQLQRSLNQSKLTIELQVWMELFSLERTKPSGYAA